MWESGWAMYHCVWWNRLVVRGGVGEGVRNLLVVAMTATWQRIDCILQLLLCGGGSGAKEWLWLIVVCLCGSGGGADDWLCLPLFACGGQLRLAIFCLVQLTGFAIICLRCQWLRQGGQLIAFCHCLLVIASCHCLFTRQWWWGGQMTASCHCSLEVDGELRREKGGKDENYEDG